MQNESVFNTLLSRRAVLSLLTVGTSGAAGLALPHAPIFTAAQPPADVMSAAFMYCDLGSGRTVRRGIEVSLSQYVSGSRASGPRRPNRLSPDLPFRGWSVDANRLPAGLDWHGASSPKTLVRADEDGVVWRGRNTTSRYFGGIRTVAEVAAPGESISVSFRSRITDVAGHPDAALRISLLRTSDSRSTLLERVSTSREQTPERCVVALTAPAGGSQGYKIVFTGEAGDGTPDQQATFEVRDLMITQIAGTSGRLGDRYLAPSYDRSAYTGGDLTIDPKIDSGDFFLVARTSEFGWVGVPVQVDAQNPLVKVSDVFGDTTCITLEEFYLVARHRWKDGWMSKVSPTASWQPLRYTNVDNAPGLSRPESPSRLSRASGLFAASSVASGAANNFNLPSLDAPPQTWSAAFDSQRWSYLSFKTDKALYIGETTVPPGVRSELHFSDSLTYDIPYWFSFAFRVNTEVKDAQESRKVVLFQTRYTKNATGDTSALGPELALEQLSGGRYAISYRTDDGVPVLSGSATPPGITTRTLGPWTAPAGRWQRVVIRAQYSRSGGGRLGVWLDGTALINSQTPLGYRRDSGPKIRLGSYKFSDYPSTSEFQNLEFGQADLSDRINRPLAI